MKKKKIKTNDNRLNWVLVQGRFCLIIWAMIGFVLRFGLLVSVQMTVCLIFMLAAPRPVLAAIFTCGDVGCLIEAIDEGNGNGENDTIILVSGVYPLKEVNNTANGANGLPSITSVITITSSEDENAIIERDTSADPFRIFHIAATGNLTLDNITVQGGVAQGPEVQRADEGGGIFNLGALNVTNSIISSNEAQGDGGGIRNAPDDFTGEGGTLHVTDSTISENTAGEDGGGIENDDTEAGVKGTAVITDCIISDNTAEEDGGGIINDGILTLTDSTISENTAGEDGGGIRNDAGKMTILDSFVSNNYAADSAGGVRNQGVLELIDSTISGNEAQNDGGGIRNAPDEDTGDGGTVEITNSIISGNAAGADGGGIENDDTDAGIKGTAVITDSTISDNTAGDDGGGIANDGIFTLTKSSVSGNSCELGDDHQGGGIYNDDGEMTITNSTVKENIAGEHAGGIENDGNMIIDYSIISFNRAEWPGGSGGGIRNRKDAYLEINDSSVKNNTCNNDGGGIQNGTNKGGGMVMLVNSSVHDNEAGEDGGGISLEHRTSQVKCINSTIANNTAGLDGGGLNQEGTLELTNCTIAGNKAGLSGGGILTHNSRVFSQNTIIARNTVDDISDDCGRDDRYPGGAITSRGNNLIGTQNGADLDCIIVNLQSWDQVGGVDGRPDPLDPGLGVFKDPSTPGLGHLPLLAGSPAIDAGNNDKGPDSDGDQIGHYRIQDGNGDGVPTIDIGAVEFLRSDPVPADYDGDGITDLAVYNPAAGMWYIMRSTKGFVKKQFGWNGPKPVPADYDDDGAADLALYDQPTGTWYFYSFERKRDNYWTQQFGWSAADPVPADYDGDGITDKAVYYPATATWYIMRSTKGFVKKQFGWSRPKTVPAGYDDDDAADLGLYDQLTETWYRYSIELDNYWDSEQFGSNGNPVTADYDK